MTSMALRSRSSTLTSRVIIGPVAMLVGDRITADRPRPCAFRRAAPGIDMPGMTR